MINLIKAVLAALFFLCLLDMPYGFYQIVRFAAMIGFAILAAHENQNSNQTGKIIFIGLALLFQPFFKIPLGRELWNVVDIVVAIGLVFSIFSTQKVSKS